MIISSKDLPQEDIVANIRVEVRSELGTSSEPARVHVYEDDRLHTTIEARVELKEDADGGMYHCVTLEQKEVSA